MMQYSLNLAKTQVFFKRFYSELATKLVKKLSDAPNKFASGTTERYI